MKNLKSWVAKIGQQTIEALNSTGSCGMLFLQAMQQLFVPPFRYRLWLKQLEFIGNQSLGVVLFTGMFTGMVFTFQSYRSLRDLGSESIIGGMVAVGMARELGPVLSSLMINARVGSAVAAEIGSMRVTEQVDALASLGVNPVQYLISPRLFAALIMVPILTACSVAISVFGGYLVGVKLLGVDSGIYFAKIRDFLTVSDICQGLVKAAFFGVLLIQVGAYKGYTTSGGAEGVGRATTEAVVVSSILILFLDYIITGFWQI